MSKLALITTWIRKNKLAIFLILIIILLLFLRNKVQNPSSLLKEQAYYPKSEKFPIDKGLEESFSSSQPPPSLSSDVIPNRMITKESFLSLVVKNVSDAQKKILKETKKLGGFVVQSYFNNPQEIASATITVRIPVKKLDQALTEFKKLAVKVVSESLLDSDITKEYNDIEARLNTLYKTKFKLEEIIKKASRISEILEAQRELTNIQQEIDTLIGQKQYLEKNAAFAKITIYLSTDELTLPYTPIDNWSPKLVFKQAVRSLVLFLRKIVTFLIWLFVYLPLIIPLILITYRLLKKKKQ